MARSTYGFSSAFDPDALLRMMYGDGPFMSSSTSGGNNYERARFAADTPPIASAGAPHRPGLDTAIAAMNAPPSFASSLMAMGLGTPTPGLTQSRPLMDPHAALFRWLGIPPSWLPPQSKAASATMPAFYGQQTADDVVGQKKLEPSDIQPAAAGDLKCEGFRGCESGGDWGTTATHSVTGSKLCRKCAIKKLGIEDSSPAEQIKTLRRYEL
jgi:hypothetical protein